MPFKYLKAKLTGGGNPFTHSLDFLAKKMAETKLLADAPHKNITALCEIRDSAVHFYNKSAVFAVRLHEVGSACVKNFAKASQDWFSLDLSQYNFYLMPLAFVDAHKLSGSPASDSAAYRSSRSKNPAWPFIAKPRAYHSEVNHDHVKSGRFL